MDLISQLVEDEGFSRWAQKCPAGKLTIGYGRNVDPAGGPGITHDEARLLLLHDIREAEDDLATLFGSMFWDSIGSVRRNALINMRFNLGPSGFRGFKRMIHAIRARDWVRAGREALDSRWATQVGRRADRIAQELASGVALD